MSFEQWYDAYPNKRGKAKAKERWDKDKLDSKDLLAKLDIEKRWRATQKQLGSFVPDWPMASTYLNQRRYADQLEDCNFAAAKESMHVGTCHCGAPVMGPRFKTCQEHYPERSYSEQATENRLEEIRAYAHGRGISTDPGNPEWASLLKRIRDKHGASIG